MPCLILANDGAPYEVTETGLLEGLTDSDINAQTGHFHLNIITGGAKTVLPGSLQIKAKAARMQYRWWSGQGSKEDWDRKYGYEGYEVLAPIQPHHSGLYSLDFCHMQLVFPEGIDFGDNYLTIYPEFSKVGQRHVHVYATQARDDDPASRLALRVVGKRANGKSFDIYISRSARSAVEKANAFIDRILEGIGEGGLKHRPRTTAVGSPKTKQN